MSEQAAGPPPERVIAFAIVAFGTLLYSNGPLYRVRTWWSYDDPVSADPVIVTVYAALGVSGAVVLFTGGRWRVLPRPLVVSSTAFAGWYLLSTLWSEHPDVTFRNSVFILATLVSAAAAALVLPLRQLAWAAWSGVFAGLFWSALVIQWGERGLDDRGNWVGVFFNRNAMAAVAALGLLLSIVLAGDVFMLARRSGPRPLLLVGLASASGAALAAAYLLNGTGSATPVVSLVAAFLAVVAAVIAHLALARSSPARSAIDPTGARRVVQSAGAVALVLIAGAWVLRDEFVGRFGRDSDLTGRTGLWDVSVEWAWRRPVQGWGYLAMWDEPEFATEAREAADITRLPSSAHNAFVEGLLGGGIVGLLLLVGFVAVVYALVGTLAVTDIAPLAQLPLALFAFALAQNLAETFVVGNHLAVAALAASATAAKRLPTEAGHEVGGLVHRSHGGGFSTTRG